MTLTDGPASWPGYAFQPGTGRFTNGFTHGAGGSARSFQLVTTYPTEVDRRVSPVITPLDFTQELQVTYANPVPWLDGTNPAVRLTEQVRSTRFAGSTRTPRSTPAASTFGDVQITTRFKWWQAGAT